MHHPNHMPLVELEATLLVLYAIGENLDDDNSDRRAYLAHTYHDRTGSYFASRFN